MVPIQYERGCVTIIDQTCLPGQLDYRRLTTLADVEQAIKTLQVRGAPLIGVAAAYGVCLALSDRKDRSGAQSLAPQVLRVLAETRPTAVNLFWALERMKHAIRSMPEQMWLEALEAEARGIHQEGGRQDAAMSRFGIELLASGAKVVTHCNTGPLATGSFGTALGVLIAGYRRFGNLHVYVDETRPRWQGAHLTTWELKQHEVPHTLICDGAAGALMSQGGIHSVWVGADRIAANGDTANKVGTYGLAVNAFHHGIPFYVVAPSSTCDIALADGGGIPIEERNPSEVSHPLGIPISPDGTPVWNPAFDITPGKLISAIVTEKGVFYGPRYNLANSLDR
jgi:methylthioribose-1-phosphate isomerase